MRDDINSKAILILKTAVVVERGFAKEMTGKQKMRKRVGKKMKALIEKNAGSYSSNDSDTDVDENTSNNSVEENNCNKINFIWW